MERTSTGFCCDCSAVIPFEVTYDCSRRRPDFLERSCARVLVLAIEDLEWQVVGNWNGMGMERRGVQT